LNLQSRHTPQVSNVGPPELGLPERSVQSTRPRNYFQQMGETRRPRPQNKPSKELVPPSWILEVFAPSTFVMAGRARRVYVLGTTSISKRAKVNLVPLRGHPEDRPCGKLSLCTKHFGMDCVGQINATNVGEAYQIDEDVTDLLAQPLVKRLLH
jgi:hypothetical protein